MFMIQWNLAIVTPAPPPIEKGRTPEKEQVSAMQTCYF